MERLRKTRLMKRCIRLGNEIDKIKYRQKCIWKQIKEVFDEYCACKEKNIEFKDGIMTCTIFIVAIMKR